MAFRKPMAYKLILLEAVAITRLGSAIWIFTWTSPQSPLLCPGFCSNLLRKCCRSQHVLKPKYFGALTLKDNQDLWLCVVVQSLSESGAAYMEIHLLLCSCHFFLLAEVSAEIRDAASSEWTLLLSKGLEMSLIKLLFFQIEECKNTVQMTAPVWEMKSLLQRDKNLSGEVLLAKMRIRVLILSKEWETGSSYNQ